MNFAMTGQTSSSFQQLPKRSVLSLALHRAYALSVLGLLTTAGMISQAAWADDGIESLENQNPTALLADSSVQNSSMLVNENDESIQTIDVETVTKTDDTRPNFTPTDIQQTNLERLKQYYQTTPKTDDTAESLTNEQKFKNIKQNFADNLLGKQPKAPVCYGKWVYPTTTSTLKQRNTTTDNAISQNPNAQNSDFPLYAEADYGYYDSEDYAELAGNVQVNQGAQQINADKVTINLKDNVAVAHGNVMVMDSGENSGNNAKNMVSTAKGSSLNSQGLISVADEIAYQTDTTKATAKDVAFASVPMQAHGYAKQLNKVDNSHYEIDDVMFTTCAPENPTWQINAKNLDINTETGRGEVYNATFKIKDKPIFYLPYFNFPVDDRRASGFLVPKAGFSNDGGLRVETPYYFNLAPNYDLTLTPTIFSTRNPMLIGDFRYLTKDFGAGEVIASYLPSDKEYQNEDRSRVLYNHFWQSKTIPNLTAHALYQYVSDPAYFDDFDTLGLENNHLNLPRRIQADYFNDYLTASAKVETFQTVDKDTVLDKDKPYQRLPQLSLNYRLPYFENENLYITGVSDFAYFKRPIDDDSAPKQSGGRLYNKLSASYPIKRRWGYITPMASLQHLYTQFDEETTIANNYTDENKSQSVFVPEFSLDTGLIFYKAGSLFGKFDQKWGGYQLISPRLKYVYSPFKDQSDVPNFNTRLASLNFPQLYENSWFLGYDRLADNNHLTPSINYRYIDVSGLTRLDASIGQQFYLSDIKVGLNNTSPMTLDSSGTVLQLSSQPYQDFWVDLDGAVNDNGGLNYHNAQLRYQPNNNALYNVGVIKRKAQDFGQRELSATTASAIFPISQNWGFLGAVQYDNLKNRYSDVLAGFTYDSCCYGFSVYGRSYYNEFDDKPNKAIIAELSLKSAFNKRQGRLASLIGDRVLGVNQLNNF